MTRPKFLFVITFGRTGSTLLQGALNSLDKVRVFGENGGFLMRLADAYAALKGAHSHMMKAENESPASAWFGGSRFVPELIAKETRTYATNLLCSELEAGAEGAHKYIGFKEIRHLANTRDRLQNYLEFLEEVFPDSRYIIHDRNIDQVLSSGWWAKQDPERARNQIRIFRSVTESFAKNKPDRVLFTDYERLLSDDSAYAEIADFLKVSYDLADYKAILKVDHSYESREITDIIRGKRPGIELKQPSWWNENVEEFNITVNRSENRLEIDGVLLVREGLEDTKLYLMDAKNGKSSKVEITPTISSPAIKKRFPNNVKSSDCRFSIKLSGETSDALNIVHKDDKIVGKITVLAD